MFCSNCGNKVEPNQAFCANCGNRLKNPNLTPTNQTSTATQEPVVAKANFIRPSWLLRTNRKLSMLKFAICNIVFYQDYLILAHLSKERQNAEIAQLQTQLKQNNTGFFKGSAEMMKFWASYHLKYQDMAPEAILGEDPMNRVINYNQIMKFKYRALDTDIDGQRSGGSLSIELVGGENLNFSHELSHKKDIKVFLESILGNRLNYRK